MTASNSSLRHDALFWRRFARFGATHAPTWWVRYSPHFFGLAAAALVAPARRAVLANLTRARGPRGSLRNALDVARTFRTYACCLAEGLAGGSRLGDPEATILGDLNLSRAIERGSGLILVTAHTAGWEIVGPLLAREHGLEVMMAMRRERDPGAQALHDRTRENRGLRVVHVGEDPLASLTLLRHVRAGGAVALQLDRVPAGVRGRRVRFFDAPGWMPEGPLRLAQAAQAPIVPVFCRRVEFRKYVIDVRPALDVPARPSAQDLDRVAQSMADEMARFLRAHSTQWFAFE